MDFGGATGRTQSPMFIGVSHSGGVAERSNAAVLKSIVAIALGCTERHSFRSVGTQMHALELSGIGVGIKVGFKGSRESLNHARLQVQ
jgi:hypothetical protein